MLARLCASFVFLLLAMPAAAQWTIVINDGVTIALPAGGTTQFEIAVTRAPGEPSSALGGGIQSDPPATIPGTEPPITFRDTLDGRCSIFVLPLPPTSTHFLVTAVAPGETVRCRARIEAAPRAAAGRYAFLLTAGGGIAVPFAVDVGAAQPLTIPAGTPWSQLGLLLGLLAAGCWASRRVR